MLQQFKVHEEDAVRVDAEALRHMVSAILEKVGVPPEDAALGADCLVAADLRGVDSHGVSNMLRYYVTGYTSGQINPRPQWSVVRETPATATVDCDGGLGIIIGPKAMEIAIHKAENTGLGMVTMNNGRHMGMASYHAMLALKHDMVGVCMTAVGAGVLPTFGREPRLGTNPIAVAVPAGKEPPFVLDIATSVVAANKLGIARRLGATIPGGYVADMDGTPIMEPGPLPDQYLVLPFGSTREMGSHKGYGLACVVEILCGILSGGGYAFMPEGGGSAGAIRGFAGRGGARHMVAAYSIEAFTDVAEFKATMDEWLQGLKATPPAPGHERVLVPGQPEHEAEQERRARGIPLHKEVIGWFQDISRELAIPYLL